MNAIFDRPAPASTGSGASSIRRLRFRSRLRSWLGACAGALLATSAAAVLLTVFVLVTETDGTPLVEAMISPLNVLRLIVMAVCLWLWGYILRTGRKLDL